MYRGFPRNLVSALRCAHDDTELLLKDERPAASGHISEGALHCSACGRVYPIKQGIVRLLDAALLDEESNNERSRREQGAQRYDASWETTPWTQMEVVPTMAASEPLAAARVLELGAGTGRYTVLMAERRASVVAVDFSLASLEKLASRVRAGWEIGLVHADCTQLAVTPHSFDLVASTLVSNLPTLQHREAMMRVAAKAMKPTGKFVFSTHHYSLRSRLRGEPQSGYYPDAKIYRYLFSKKEIDAETRRYFADVASHPIQIAIPFLGRLGRPAVTVSRLAERVPAVNKLGTLLLVVAQRPAANT